MRLHLTIVLGLVGGGASPGWAQVSAPLLGYFPDGGRVRPVLGMAASASVAKAMEGGEFARIAAAPGGDFLLVSSAATGEVFVLRPGLGTSAIRGAGIGPDSISLSPGGAAGALWFAESRRVQLVRGLRQTPEVREIDVAFLGQAPEALAVSDDGEWLAGAWADGLHAFGPHGEANWLPLEGSRHAVAFFDDSHDVAVATGRGLFRVIDLGGRAEMRLLLESAMEPLAVGVAARNRKAVVVEARGRVITLDLETGSTSSVECSCSPEGLFGVGRSIFRLTGLKHGAYLLFDADRGETLFAPLTAEEVEP